MGLTDPVNKGSYNDITKSLCETSIPTTEELMNDAAMRLRKMQFPEETITDQVADVAVTVDGTWQHRGHSSKHGVVFIISVVTGEVLNYVVKTLHCKSCSVNKNKLSKEKFSEWYGPHKTSCPINHTGASGNMEAAAAIEMFLRSVEKHSLKYTIYVGDGDSSSFAKVKDACAEKFGNSYNVVKEECLGHVQKRMGAGLLELKKDKRKLDDGKGIGGKGRLTKKMVEKIQNNYGYAIRGNVGNQSAMKNAIMAVLKHTVIEKDVSLDDQHSLCPKDDWCKYWTNPNTYSQSNRLPPVFFDLLKPLFNRLSSDDLLSRCQRGFTQNQNESVNGVLWGECSKRKFCGITKLTLAVSQSVGEFNAGAGTTALLMKKAGIGLASSSMRSFRAKDRKRILFAAKKITLKARTHRQKLRIARKASKSKTDYKAGSFDLKQHPEKYIQAPSKRKSTSVQKEAVPAKRLKKLDKNDKVIKIRFIDDEDVEMIHII